MPFVYISVVRVIERDGDNIALSLFFSRDYMCVLSDRCRCELKRDGNLCAI